MVHLYGHLVFNPAHEAPCGRSFGESLQSAVCGDLYPGRILCSRQDHHENAYRCGIKGDGRNEGYRYFVEVLSLSVIV